TLRLDLAQYRELAAFAQFASDLDAKTRAQLERGARLVEMLKQDQYVPLSIEKQVLVIYAATQGFVDDLPIDSLGRYEQELYSFVNTKFPDLLGNIGTAGSLSDDIKAQLQTALEAFGDTFLAADEEEDDDDDE
ncbi:MAG TPA: F0F1 ATP synthase subunit alpha, partial [Sorangium sp.]|nr:F0F1 ATP synthase subunit alpha [Sorangium sp.]